MGVIPSGRQALQAKSRGTPWIWDGGFWKGAEQWRPGSSPSSALSQVGFQEGGQSPVELRRLLQHHHVTRPRDDKQVRARDVLMKESGILPEDRPARWRCIIHCGQGTA